MVPLLKLWEKASVVHHIYIGMALNRDTGIAKSLRA